MQNAARFFVVVSLAAACSAALAQTPNMFHAHIGHVADRFKDTPKQQGFLPTAASEAQIAATYAGLALKMTTDLGHIVGFATNTTKAADSAAQGIRKATTAAEAAPAVTQMNTAAAAMLSELKQAQDHMALMKKGEGLK